MNYEPVSTNVGSSTSAKERALRANGPVRLMPRLFKAEHAYVWSAAGAPLRKDRATCPVCEVGQLRFDNEDQRRCDQCGAGVTLDDLAIKHGPRMIANATYRKAKFERFAAVMVVITAGLITIGAYQSYTVGSVGPIFASLLIAGPCGMCACAMRYRAWQAATGRTFEDKAPLGDFMRAEVRALLKR